MTAAEANLNQDSNDKAQENWVEKSWEFLDIITEKVEKLPAEVQAKIIEAGREFASAGASYNHDDHKPHRPPISPAKIAALKEASKGTST